MDNRENHNRPNDDAFYIAHKAGYLPMNRTVINEDAGSEILKILELKKSSLYKYPFLYQKGIGRFIEMRT